VVGLSYIVGKGVGYTDILEAWSGTDWATQEDIGTLNRIGRWGGGIGKLAGNAALLSTAYTPGMQSGTLYIKGKPVLASKQSPAYRSYLNEKFGRTGNLHHDINLRGYYERISALDVGAGLGKSVFYSGPDNRLLAEAFAKRTGRMTLEMTKGGRWLEQQPIRQLFTRPEVDHLWRTLSARYADGSTGIAHAFGNGSYAYPSATFTDVEMRILRAKGKLIRFYY